jgi:lysophospholipase L1-like esterase
VWSRARVLPAGAAGLLAIALLTSACHGAPAADPSGTGTSAASGTGTPSGVTSAAAAAPAAPSPTQSANAISGRMVALGDSYTAGALLPLDAAATPPGCLRSDRAYPALVAVALHAPLTDAACASAGVKNMTVAQPTYLGTNPAQFGALGPADAVVLLTLSGDDMGFLNVLNECVKLSFTNPWGSPCLAHYGDNYSAQVAAESAKMTLVLRDIAARAPRARIVLVGYPDMFPRSGGCWPRVPITSGDITWLRGIEFQLNAMLAAVAQPAGATFVDTYTPTIGHDFCQPESVRDVEGLVPGSLALPFHPNARGQAAIAGAVLKALLSQLSP